VLAVDLPGHARSAGPALPTIEAIGDWTLAFLDAAGVRKAALVGHSMGSLIALEAAARNGASPAPPQRVTHLVMIGTAYPMKVSPGLLSAAHEAPLRAIDMVNTLSHSTIAAKPAYPGPGSWLHGGNRVLMRRVQAGHPSGNLFHHDFALCDRYANGMQAASKVTCPVTLVLGARDQMAHPKASAELAAALKARVLTLPAGHSLMAEAPDAVLNALRSALC